MKTVRKRLVSVIIVAVLLFSITSLSGCYSISSGKMKNVVGTYELTNYMTNENEIEENGVKLYIVIKGDGTGYYAYRDNDTPLYFSELRCRYTQDPEKSGYYEYVEIDFTGAGDWKKLGIYSKLTSKTLNSNLPKYKGNLFEGNLEVDYYIDVDFTRVSRATDLSYITDVLGDADLLPYGAMRLCGTYFTSVVTSDNPDFPAAEYESPFVYCYIDIDLYTGQGEAWYMLKADEERMNTTFSVSVSGGSGEYSVRLGETDVKIYVSGSYVQYMHIPSEVTVGESTYSVNLEFTYGGDRPQEEIDSDIEFQITAYQNSKAS